MSGDQGVPALGESSQTGALPPLHATWLGVLTGIGNRPSEPKATCGDCIMCAGVERSGSHVVFSPDIKCCSYVPHLANFLVGQSLRGPGRDSIRARIARRAGVTPLGLGLSHADIRRMVGAQSQFGVSAAVVCPHFVTETRGCAIWQTRNAVCSTWFCKHDRGAVSQRFWQAVRDLLIAAEESISSRCLNHSGLADEQVNAVAAHRRAIQHIVALANSGSAVPENAPVEESAEWYDRMWGEWAGREEDWFLACADSLTKLTDDELVASMLSTRHLAEAVKDRWRDLSVHDLPDRLVFSPGAGSEATEDVLRLIGYSPYDPLVLPVSLHTALARLDGQPIAELPDGNSPTSTALTDDLLGRLYDFGVALAPTAPTN